MLKYFQPMSKALKRRSHFYRRFHASCYAWRDILRRRASYSQWAEDALIRDYLKENGGIPPGWMYVDVGANHPTVISDTYLFYKSGYNGICVEPNVELADLFARFRPRDIVIPAAVAATRGLLKFYVTDNPVFSSLSEQTLEDRVASVRLVPVITLDDLVPCFDLPGVFLLKVDTEGHDCAVLVGATKLLQRTLVVLTETRDEQERQEHLRVLGDGWEVIWAEANTIFVNKRLMAQCQSRS